MCKPFVKWAGGKSQLINEIGQYYPKNDSRITKYCEPFVGGGAIFFDIVKKYSFNEILINDLNEDLICAYNTIKNNVNKLIDILDNLQTKYFNANDNFKKALYYNYRDIFNSKQCNPIKHSALFIFLNKTCFNGLYRVNAKGEYNVPVGDSKKPNICDSENLLKVSSALQNVIINCGDYKDCLSFIDNKTFVYLDPPYKALNNTSSFTAYTKQGFNDDDQYELSKFCKELKRKGATILISNSDPQDENECFFDKLYDGFYIERVLAKRYINCNAAKRGDIKELLISCGTT